MYVLEVRNAELIESLTRQAAELGITNAAIVALIGAIDSFTVSTNPAGDATAHTYSSYPLPAEMTATGEIVGGKPHIHAVMAVQGDRTIGGHLHKAHLHTSFARAYVIPSEHHVDVPPHEQIVFEQPADEGPTSRGRISDTRVAPRPTQTRIEALSKHFPAKELQTTTSKKQLNKAITSKGIIMTSNTLDTPKVSAGFDINAHFRAVMHELGLSPENTGGTITFVGEDPIFPSVHRLGACISIPIMAGAAGIADIWRQRTGRGQDLTLDLRKAIHGINPMYKSMPTINGYPYQAPYGLNPSYQIANPMIFDLYRTRARPLTCLTPEPSAWSPA